MVLLLKNDYLTIVISYLFRMNWYYYIIIAFSLSSCESVFHADIINESNEKIFLKIQFDSIELEKKWNGKNYIGYLKSYPQIKELNNSKFDSINLVGVYEVKPNSTFPLESGIGRAPTFEYFKSINILFSDTIILDSKEKIIKSFINTGNRDWVLRVQ